jgi:NifU-like protein involved in Fe-S cluster formation
MIFNSLTLEHFERPRCVGVFPPNTPSVITRTLGNPDAELFVHVYLQQEHYKIIQARFTAIADPFVIAILSYLCEHVDRVPEISADDLLHCFELPALKKHEAGLLLDLFRL